jgi:hypothetical protein
MIKDADYIFNYPDLVSNSSNFFIDWTSTSNSTAFTVSFSISSYVSTYTIRYLIIIIDTTALDLDYPQYMFKADIF